MTMTTYGVDIAGRLRELDVFHRQDGDGGYSLLNAILAYAVELGSQNRLLLRCHLLDLIAKRDATLWGVALEALVQQWGQEVSSELASLLGHNPVDDEWTAQLLLTLLRLKSVDTRDQAVVFITRRINDGDLTVLPWLAAMCNVDRCECIRMTSELFVNEYRKGRLKNSEGYIPAFVRNFIEVDRKMIFELAKQVYDDDPMAAKETMLMFLDYIQKPFFEKEFGGDTASEIEDGIREIIAV